MRHAFGVVDHPQRLHDRVDMHRHGARDLVGVDEAVGQHLDVAVEDQPDDLEVLVDDRAARVAADDVVAADVGDAGQ